MAIVRSILSAVGIFLLAAGIVLQLFVILSGVTTKLPLNKVYFLQAETSGISTSSSSSPSKYLHNGNIPNPARWTYFAICGADGNGNDAHCGKVGPAIPFDPVVNFGTEQNQADSFVKDAKFYYYMSRVSWSFYIIAIVFAVIALLLSVLALCSRLAAKFTGLVALIAAICQAVTAALMTAWTYKARSAFRSNNQEAKLGTYAYAFTWAAFACWLIATILFCVGGGRKEESSYGGGKSSGGAGAGYFGRNRSTKSTTGARSRGSFRDSESGRRVKDEYD